MWGHEYGQGSNPFKEEPFVQISEFTYMDCVSFWARGLHTHEDYELLYFVSGTAQLDLGESTLPLETGSVAVIPPDTPHQITCRQPEEPTYYSLHFCAQRSGGQIEHFFRRRGIAAAQCGEVFPLVKNQLQLLVTCHVISGGVVDETFQLAAMTLLHLTMQVFEKNTTHSCTAHQEQISRVLQYIVENPRKRITMKELAQRFNFSESHLNRLFRNAYHISPIKLSLNLRIHSACEMLASTELSCSQIAQAVGYESQPLFISSFTKRTGYTPAAYRAEYRKNHT